MGQFARKFGPVYEALSTDIFKFAKALKFEPTWQQAQLLGVIQRGDLRVAVRSGQGPGKCVLDTTFVLAMLDGMAIRTTVGELVSSGKLFRVASMDPATEKILFKDAAAMASGEKECVRVAVDSGQRIDLSADHPMYTPLGWVQAGKLAVGDLVAMPRKLPSPERELAISDEEVRFVAGMICDGSCSSGNCDITHLPGTFLDLFLEDVKALGGGATVTKQVTKALTYQLTGMRPVIRKWGMDGVLSKHKKVPAPFFSLSDRQLGVFLNTIWACDGYLVKDGFEIGLASRQLVDDIQTLLLRFGVHSRSRYKLAKCQTGKFDAWVLRVSGQDNIINLVSAMGMPVGKELQTEAMFDTAIRAETNTNTDIVPVRTHEQVGEMLAEVGFVSQRGSWAPQGRTLTSVRDKYRGRKTSYWSRKKLEGFCKEFHYQGQYAKWATNDIYWVKVEGVKPIGVHPVYDLTVPETHNFVANNLIVHNTTTSVVVALFRTLRCVNAMTVLTAPTMRQCNDIWLAEARRLLAGADPWVQQFIKTTKTKIEVNGNPDWGVKTVTATKDENAQGFHEKNMTIICEEASGVSRKIIEQFEGTASNPNCLFLQIGNPNCVMGHVEVYDPSRGRVTVAELAQSKSCRVATMFEDAQSITKATAKAFFSGEKECISVRVSTGQQIDLSTDHPVFTPHGWIKAGELALDDLVAMPRLLPAPDTFEDVPDEEVKFVAYMLTDGNCTQDKGTTSRCGFSQMRNGVLAEFCNVVESLGGSVTVREAKGLAVNANSAGMQGLLRKWNIGCKNSKEKRVPSKFFLMDDRKISLFLNRMWSCDGSFNRYGPKMCLNNKRLLDDVQALLLRLGIHSAIWYTPVTIRDTNRTFEYLRGRTFDAWTLAVTEKDSIRRWLDTIGPVLGKEDKLARPEGYANPNSDIVPVTNKELDEMLEEMGFGGKERSRLRYRYGRVRRMSRATFKLFCMETGYSGKYRVFADNDLRWVFVREIKSLGRQPVYDLTVPSTGNFVAQNLVIHNTRDCAFFDCFHKDRKNWTCLHWNAEETPQSIWFDPIRNVQLAEKYGRDSDIYRIRVLGEFPHTDPQCIISSEDLEKVVEKDRLAFAATRTRKGELPRQMGLDFARFGGDENTLYRRSGNAIVEHLILPHAEPSELVNAAFGMQRRAAWSDDKCLYVPDAGGIGQGIMHRFYEEGKRVLEFHNGGSAARNDIYDNRVTEAWFGLGQKIKEVCCYLPNDPLLFSQLTARKYFTTKKGKLIIESKDEYMKRGNDSPDRADGIVMAMYDEVEAVSRITSAGEAMARKKVMVAGGRR